MGNVIYAAASDYPISMLDLFGPHGVFSYFHFNFDVYAVADSDDITHALFARELPPPDWDRRVPPN